MTNLTRINCLTVLGYLGSCDYVIHPTLLHTNRDYFLDVLTPYVLLGMYRASLVHTTTYNFREVLFTEVDGAIRKSGDEAVLAMYKNVIACNEEDEEECPTVYALVGKYLPLVTQSGNYMSAIKAISFNGVLACSEDDIFDYVAQITVLADEVNYTPRSEYEEAEYSDRKVMLEAGIVLVAIDPMIAADEIEFVEDPDEVDTAYRKMQNGKCIGHYVVYATDRHPVHC